MSDNNRSAVVVLGTIVGVAAVAVAVAVYTSKHQQEPPVKNVDDILEEARKTVRKLDDAVDLLRKSA